MSSIKKLDRSLASKIAAGEVIERPVSVVKELVENSIDADSTRITVNVLQGGKSDIIVEDDGTGIPGDELVLATSSHATSKISSERDLDSIITLGYRGEALWSISSVSRLEIRSRTPGNSSGGKLTLSSGQSEPKVESVNCPMGTRVQVSDLFFNLPARRKFMTSARGEFTRISRLVKDLALLYPEKVFTLVHDDRQVFCTMNCGTRKKVLELIWGSEPDILSFLHSENDMEIEVWHQPVSGKRPGINTFVNGRIVRDPVIKAAANASDAGLAGNMAIFLRVPPRSLDVNIHPAKAEVRFKNSGSVFEAVRNAVALAVGRSVREGQNVTSPTAREGQSLNYDHRGRDLSNELYDSLTCRVSSPDFPDKRFADHSESNNLFRDPAIETGEKEDISYIGQMMAGYLVYEKGRTLMLMDLHAAHERINFEKIKKTFNRGVNRQMLSALQPVSAALNDMIEEYPEELKLAGFSFVREGGNLFLSEVPSFLFEMSLGAMEVLRTIIAELEISNSLNTSLERTLWLKWADMACKRSLKLSSRIGSEEAYELYSQLKKCNNPLFCPHGRPVLIFLDLDKLSREFGRN